MERLELRVMQSSIVTNDEDLIVEGLVNKTESWSHTLGVRKKFKEKICRGAFDKAIQKANRIDFLCEHDSSKLLSTTENNSLQLWEDEEGLKMRAVICPTTYGRDLYELMRSKLVNHMSFGFRVLSDKWKKLSNGTFERIVEELELLEVSAVRNPAYPQSAIAARGIELVEDVEIPDDIQEERSNKMAENNEERAHATRLYSKTEVINSAMNIVAECSSLSEYLMKYIGDDKDTASVLVALQHSITMANKIINDEIQVLVDDFNKYDSEAKEMKEAEGVRSVETETQEAETVEEKVEEATEVKVETEATEETTEEVEEKVEETEEVETQAEEGRSFDLSAFRKRIRDRR